MKEFFINIDEIKSQFFRIGNGEKKLIILHGWNQEMDIVESYQPLIDELSEYDFLENF